MSSSQLWSGSLLGDKYYSAQCTFCSFTYKDPVVGLVRPVSIFKRVAVEGQQLSGTSVFNPKISHFPAPKDPIGPRNLLVRIFPSCGPRTSSFRLFSCLLIP